MYTCKWQPYVIMFQNFCMFHCLQEVFLLWKNNQILMKQILDTMLDTKEITLSAHFFFELFEVLDIFLFLARIT